LLGKIWEAVESGNCAKCGKLAKLRRKGEHADGKVYCSPECYYENFFKVPKYEFVKPKFDIPEIPKSEEHTCAKCGYKGHYCYPMEKGEYYCKPCFNEYLEEIKNSFSSPSDKNYKEKYTGYCF